MKSKMTSKTWSWTLAAVLSISSLSFSSCSNNDENIVDTPKTAPAANQQTMKLSGNTWVRAYEAKGKAGAGSAADKNTDFSINSQRTAKASSTATSSTRMTTWRCPTWYGVCRAQATSLIR